MTSHHRASEIGEGTRPLAYATCVISGDDVEPAFWTKFFSVEPSTADVKGKPFKTPSGRTSSRPGRTGVWALSSKSVVSNDVLNPHIVYLISRLKLPREDLSRLIGESGATLSFLCFWSNYSGRRVPLIDPALRKIVESCGGIIQIDEYPQHHKIINKDGAEIDTWV
ncbi:MAG: DUF4279 domain-containing protein [Stellaceae bacterium]